MSKKLTIVSVKCIAPSSGINTVVKGVSGLIGGGIAGVVAVPFIMVSGVVTEIGTLGWGTPVLLAVGGGALAGAFAEGAIIGVDAIEGLDRTFSGADELFVNIDYSGKIDHIKCDKKEKVWPTDSKYQKINSQETKQVDVCVLLDKQTNIQLWEYDTIGDNDLLGYLTLNPSHSTGDFTYVLPNEKEGSIYEINISIVDN